MPEPTDERDLVIQSQRGDRLAFEELVRRTARLLFARAYLETGDPHRSEDLVQETLLVAWRSIGQVSDPSGFRPWLVSILQTRAVDLARRESRKKRGADKHARDGDAILRLADHAPTPSESAETRDERERTLAVLRSLPSEYRQVLMLRYLAGADYDTISRQLALTNGSLRGLLHRGMAMLRAELTKSSSLSPLRRGEA
ncbi:MAG: sigma-70 family RNA polymerase sigma factor [Tepidisphaeraceae bacterium]